MIEHKILKGSIALEAGQFSMTENLYQLYYNFYGKMSSLYSPDFNAEKTPDINKICKFIEKKFTFKKYVSETSGNKTIFYFFDNDKMIRITEDKFSKNSSYIINYEGDYPKRLVDALNSLFIIKEKHKKNIGVIVQEANGFGVYYTPLDRCEFLEENYNEDLVENHPKIIEQLNSTKNGVHLFYGVPGTGKTSYISTLTNLVEKNLIYVPISIAAQLDSPQFLKLFMNNTNSIFVIEDAEKIITSREKNGNSPIAALLNLSDGLLGQSLKCQFICTFNTNLENVDIALLRKGRLLSSYEFRPLEKEKATKLAKKLGKEYKEGETTLGDIYNSEVIKNSVVNKIRQTIGFKIA
jgi:SpoVK/Ycf46/Vps4 family AAA+-type ATPase